MTDSAVTGDDGCRWWQIDRFDGAICVHFSRLPHPAPAAWRVFNGIWKCRPPPVIYRKYIGKYRTTIPQTASFYSKRRKIWQDKKRFCCFIIYCISIKITSFFKVFSWILGNSVYLLPNQQKKRTMATVNVPFTTNVSLYWHYNTWLEIILPNFS